MNSERYQVEIVDASYYKRMISCQDACPVRTDARGYVNAIADGDYEAGYIRARQPNPFASICGRVCAAHCEKACRRGKIDTPITIRSLKRFLCELYGIEAKSYLPLTRETGKGAGITLLTGKTPGNALTAESFSQLSLAQEKKTAKESPDNVRVAIIGTGPAGLSAAHDLALLGYKVIIFEAAPSAGGMTALGIPEYRLPRDILKSEIEEILDLGVEMKLNTRLGMNFNLDTLREQRFKAVFIAIGAHKDRGLDVEGIHLDGVLPAVDFLRNVNLGYKVELGDKVAVVGGGDVAVDAARLAARLEEVCDLLATGNLVTVMDVTRRALHLGVKDVHIVYRGTREEMRASQEELEGALEEGTSLHTGLLPKRILGSDGKVAGLETLATRSIYDEKGRRILEPISGSESIIDCSSVIMAIGQESDLSFIRPEDRIMTSKQGTIMADNETLATTAPGIFAGGDVVYGPRTIIEAVADGHKAARSIDNYLKGGQVNVTHRSWMVEVPTDYLPNPDYQQTPSVRPAKIPLDRRTGVSEVEMVYDEASAYKQSQRCLKCHVQTVFNSELCILCGGCVDICPKHCLKMVPVEKIAGTSELMDLIKVRYGENILAPHQAGVKDTRSLGTAMIKNETRCIRCGLCYRRCPMGAITMEAFRFEEQLAYAGEPL
ncbi:MAG: FAD-dependent oxidoreductase [Dehalococcoidales bacterium]|nr:FAD-dependent oxidoreductase [Dehalococcoidales bacterium]